MTVHSCNGRIFNTLADLPELAKVPEVAAYARVSPDTIYAGVASGEIAPVVRLGRVLRIPRATVARWTGASDTVVTGSALDDLSPVGNASDR
jgi:excisionase family DNA binding protein